MTKKEIITTKEGFYIGDPSYALVTNWENLAPGLEHGIAEIQKVNVTGHTLVAVSTSEGIGYYQGKNDKIYTVGEGFIGVLPLEAVDGGDLPPENYGEVIKGYGEVTVTYDGTSIRVEFSKSFGQETIEIDTETLVELDTDGESFKDWDFDEDLPMGDGYIEFDEYEEEDIPLEEAFTAEELAGSAPSIGLGWDTDNKRKRHLEEDGLDVYEDEFEVDDWIG